MAGLEKAAARRFFQAEQFAVAGAVQEPDRFGHKIFVWYQAHSLPVTPLHPKLTSISTHLVPTPTPVLPSPLHLPSPTSTSLSIVTPPRATLGVLAEARAADVHAVWLQDGTYDGEVLKMLKEDDWWEGRWIGPGSEGRRGGQGWCVLVDGEDGLRAAGKLEGAEGRL